VGRNYDIRDDGIMEAPPIGTYATLRPIELLLFRPGNPEERLTAWLRDILQERSATIYRLPFSDSGIHNFKAGEEATVELAVPASDTQRARQKQQIPEVANADSEESSRGLEGPSLSRDWPGEHFLQRRYSEPNLSISQRLGPLHNSSPSPRSTH